MHRRNFFTILVAIFGLKLCYLISPLVAVLYFIVFAERRKGVLQYAAAIDPQTGGFGRLRSALKIRTNHVRRFFDSAGISCGAISVGSIGMETIGRALDEKRGVIILCSHFGPWRAVFKCLKFTRDIYVLGRRDRSYLWNDKFISEEKTRSRVTELENDSDKFSLFDAYVALKKGDIVGMAGDRMNENKRGTVNFLNKRVHLPIAPFRLANKSGAVVIPVFAYKTSFRKILVHFYDPILPEPDPETMQLRYVRLLEENILKFPHDFYPPPGSWIDSVP